jgi:hypothetical protein
MFKVIVEKECGCFKKSDMQNGITMDSKDGALLKAIEMKTHMNDEFCGKHTFKVQEVQNNFVIAFEESTSNGCCGGGCGSH